MDKLEDNREVDFLYLAEKLHQQFKRQEFCDVTLVHGGQSISANGGVLCASSPYFETMFRSSFTENEAKSVNLSKVVCSFENLKHILDYLYTGNIKLADDNIEDILHGASLMLLPKLQKYCEQFMLQNISNRNCLHTWHLAELFDLSHAKIICRQIIKSRFYDCLWNSRDIGNISQQDFIMLVQLGCFSFLDEEQIAETLKIWLRFHSRDRMSCLHNIMKTADAQARKLTTCIEKVMTEFDAGETSPFGSDAWYTGIYSADMAQRKKTASDTGTKAKEKDTRFFLLSTDCSNENLAIYDNISMKWRVMATSSKIDFKPVGIIPPFIVLNHEDEVQFIDTRGGDTWVNSLTSSQYIDPDCIVTESSFFCIKGYLYSVIRLHINRNNQSSHKQIARYHICKYDMDNRNWSVVTSVGITPSIDDRYQYFCKLIDSTVVGDKGLILLQKSRITDDIWNKVNKLLFVTFDPDTSECIKSPTIECEQEIADNILSQGNKQLFVRQLMTSGSLPVSSAQTNPEPEVENKTEPNTLVYDINNNAWGHGEIFNPVFKPDEDAVSYNNGQNAELVSSVGSIEVYLQRELAWANTIWLFKTITGDLEEIPSPPIRNVKTLKGFSSGNHTLDLDLMENVPVASSIHFQQAYYAL